MTRYLSSALMISLALGLAMLAIILPAGATPTYLAGVTGGQSVSYTTLKANYISTIPILREPQSLIDLNRTVLATLTVHHVSSPPTNVTLHTLAQFKNGTTSAEVLVGDLETGVGNLSYVMIAGGLTTPNRLWNNATAPTINDTIAMTYLGLSRTVNIYNTTLTQRSSYFGYPIVFHIKEQWVYDQASGAFLEATSFLNVTSSLGSVSENVDVRIQSTNIFGAPAPPADYTVAATSPNSVETGVSATTTITVKALNDFGGTITLADTPPDGLACNAIYPRTITSHGTATLSCSSTSPGTYRVTIIATGPYGTRTATATVVVTSHSSPVKAPSADMFGLAPLAFYGVVGAAVAVIAAAGALVVARSKVKEPETPGRSSIA